MEQVSPDLELEVKQLIIDSLSLEDIEPEDIDSEEPLFGDGLGLDSIDALELGIALQKTYNIKLEEGAEENKNHFSSIHSLVAFVQTTRNC
ncbi:MAG TPA: acyl carrier protein [Candidatus Lambdaproteobacteria bacterium]|nr:acyl carrier protein [Candidatus Lambdaproteobacteria bacterium]